MRLVSYTTKTTSSKLLACFASTRTFEDRLGEPSMSCCTSTPLLVQHVQLLFGGLAIIDTTKIFGKDFVSRFVMINLTSVSPASYLVRPAEI